MTCGHRVDDVLDALLAAPTVQLGAARQAEIESVLTAGYAQTLELEAERLRLIEQLEPADLVDAISERLVSLRDRLDEAKRRFGGSRQNQFDRRPDAGRRTD